nr:glycosyltransferase family 4 protein [Clostridia bacterium]
IAYLREYGSALLAERKLAARVYREIGFDVIHGCNPPDLIYVVARRYQKKGVRYVFDHHDVCPELYEAKFGRKGLLYQSQLFFERQTFRHCQFAFATNESYRNVALTRGGMRPENVLVLRSGPNLERLRIQPPTPSLRRGRRFLVSYVGVIGEQEGMPFLLAAADAIRRKRGRDDVAFGVVGGGPALDAARALCAKMGLDDMVTFTGRVPDDMLLAYLNTADVCVNADAHNAMNDMSTMNKVLEYMALGKPIVQFDLKEGRVSAQDASLYACPNDADDMAAKILELLDNEPLRRKMGAAGRCRIETELSWAHTSQALLKGYDRIFADIEAAKR